MNDTDLREELALTRTALANERTLLSYARTALAFLLTGATLLHFFYQTTAIVLGAISLSLGAALMLIAVMRFLQIRKKLAQGRAL